MSDRSMQFSRFLKKQFKSAVRWRGSQAVRYPGDAGRNTKAAIRLAELESQIDIPDAFWKEASDFRADCARWQAAVSQANRDVGFRSHPLNFNEYLNDILANVALQPTGGVQ